MDAGRWDNEQKILVDPALGKKRVSFSVIVKFVFFVHMNYKCHAFSPFVMNL
jgi:hypothetical protein